MWEFVKKYTLFFTLLGGILTIAIVFGVYELYQAFLMMENAEAFVNGDNKPGTVKIDAPGVMATIMNMGCPAPYAPGNINTWAQGIGLQFTFTA